MTEIPFIGIKQVHAEAQQKLEAWHQSGFEKPLLTDIEQCAVVEALHQAILIIERKRDK